MSSETCNLGDGIFSKSHEKSWNFDRSNVQTLTWELNKFYTVKALVSGHPRDGIKMSVTGAGRLREWFS